MFYQFSWNFQVFLMKNIWNQKLFLILWSRFLIIYFDEILIEIVWIFRILLLLQVLIFLTFNFMDFSFVQSAAAAGAIIDPSGNYSAADIIRVWVSLVVLVAGLCSILFIVWGWLMLILSGGKDEKVKPAINSIRYAVIGIIVIVIAIFVAPKVSEMLGLGTHQYLSPQNIFNTIKVLMNQIFWGSNDTYFDGSSNNALPDGFSDL